MTDSTEPTHAQRPPGPAAALPDDGPQGAVAHDPDNAAAAGIVENPEVPAMPQTPPAPPPVALPAPPPSGWPDGGQSSPWARPATFTPPPSWDQSGYAPPAAIRIDEHGPGAIAAGPGGVTTYAGLYPVPASAAGGLARTASPAGATSAAVAAARPNRFSRVQLRTSLTILLFIAGVAVGVAGLRLATPAHPNVPDGFPTLSRTAIEPLPASAVAQELAKNDVHGLAQLLDSDTLTAIQTQLKPFVTFESVTFVGATTDARDTLAGYVVRGRDAAGNLGLVGLVIRLRDGQVVAQ